MKSIIKTGVFYYKEADKARKFYNKWKKRKFKIYDAGSGSDTWALYAIKNGGKKEILEFDDGYILESEQDLQEIKSSKVFD